MGTYEELKHGNGYTQSLVQASVAAEADPAISSEEASPQSCAAPSKKEHKAKEVKQSDDSRRQLGDHTVYAYYFGSVGVVFAITLLGLEIGWAFLQCFPSMFSPFSSTFV